MTGRFRKSHLGDRDEMLPTVHGFDEFFGNLYHLNAEEEPENPDYPKDPDFKKKFGPRGVLHSFADGRITDTGPLTKKRMETVDEEVTVKALDFMDRAKQADKPFFMWWITEPRRRGRRQPGGALTTRAAARAPPDGSAGR